MHIAHLRQGTQAGAELAPQRGGLGGQGIAADLQRAAHGGFFAPERALRAAVDVPGAVALPARVLANQRCWSGVPNRLSAPVPSPCMAKAKSASPSWRASVSRARQIDRVSIASAAPPCSRPAIACASQPAWPSARTWARQAASTAAVRPGVACEAIDAAARRPIEAEGYGEAFFHRTGHGIGLEGHEDPYLIAGNDLPLRAGMAFSVEPGIYLVGEYGARIEDIVVCGPDGPITLNEAPRELAVVDG